MSIKTTTQGTAVNIPNDKELWVLILVNGVQGYYPQPGPVKVGNDGTWSVGVTVGTNRDPGRTFVLYAALVDKNSRAAIDKYFTQTPNPGYVGIYPLPQGIKLISAVNVIRA